LIITNHPCFIDLTTGYFEAMWISLPDFESNKLIC
jgi:hypothetical protein